MSYSMRKQKGAALLVSLMILVIISLIGIAAMRTSLFNAKISTSAKASTMVFEGAETAISAVFKEGRYVDLLDPGQIFASAISAPGVIIDRCVTGSSLYKPGACTSVDFLDQRDLVKSGSRTAVVGRELNAGAAGEGGNRISGANRYVYFQFATAAKGEMPVLNIEQHTIQEFALRGLDVADF
ncbi:MAG: PilX N-terminal domain-containing pilus assembly protein [Alcanivoracaceae bacterium]|nr:PilX N-terminal domain-containing pilus assembly protein [Alcanivoracaceae bacterium]